MSIITYEIKDHLGVISHNNPPVNALSHALRTGVKQAVENAQEDASKALIIFCEGRTFIASVDIMEFGNPPLLPSLPDLVNAIESSEKPVIAATVEEEGCDLIVMGCKQKGLIEKTMVTKWSGSFLNDLQCRY